MQGIIWSNSNEGDSQNAWTVSVTVALDDKAEVSCTIFFLLMHIFYQSSHHISFFKGDNGTRLYLIDVLPQTFWELIFSFSLPYITDYYEPSTSQFWPW